MAPTRIRERALLAALIVCVAAPAAATRERLLAEGEAALARGAAAQAGELFERAGFVKHAAEAELGLIRSYLQAGEYRRALVFAAHTAGAHPDAPEGAALYAYLLHLGGQGRVAGLVLARAREKRPADARLSAAGDLLADKALSPPGALLEPPARFAPYSPQSDALPAAARVTASGVLIAGGRQALVPRGALRNAGALWVRDALGRVSAARVSRRLGALGLALVELDTPLVPAAQSFARGDPFPGAPAYVAAFAAGDALPAWPRLRIGFLGRRDLGLALEGDGAAVLDGAGRLAGVALKDAEGRDVLARPSAIEQELGEGSFSGGASPPAKLGLDEIYERALSSVVQVIQ